MVHIVNFHVYESALDHFDIVRLAYVIKLNGHAVLSDGQYSTNGTVYQASVSVNIATQYDTCSDGQDKLGFQSYHHITLFVDLL